MKDTSRFLCAPHPFKVASSWVPIGTFVAFASLALSVEASDIDSGNASLFKEGSLHSTEQENTFLLQTKVDVQSVSKDSDEARRIVDHARRNMQQITDAAGIRPQASQECKWQRTSTCSAAGLPTSDPGYRNCNQRVPLSEVGFCDCDGDGVQEKTELQFDCFSTPGRCSNLCQPKKLQIPNQIIMTGLPSTPMGLPAHLLDNVGKTARLNERMQLRYFSDKECIAYLQEHYDPELASLYMKEHKGSYRGDICRGAVLYREGGFYTDVDLEVAMPFISMIDENTHFMTAFDARGNLLNALMAAIPFSPVMGAYLREVRAFYKNGLQDEDSTRLMGPFVLNQAMKMLMAERCPEIELTTKSLGTEALQWACGNESYRIYKEAEVRCEDIGAADECPTGRKQVAGIVPGANYGLFDWTERGPPRTIVGWSRVAGCGGWNCGSDRVMRLTQDDASSSKSIPVTPLRRARLNHTLNGNA